MERYVAYYRVSTKKQGLSFLGINAQKSQVSSYIDKKGKIISEYTEIESGKKNQREKLLEAIEEAKRKNAILIIAKLDRLSRNASFIFSLRDSGVKFVCADMPDANTLTIGIFATLAQYERELISSRTKAAIAEKKKTGWRAGSPKGMTESTRQLGRKAKSEKAKKVNSVALKIAKDALASGLSLAKVSERLNQYNIKTSRCNTFTKASVQSLLKLGI